MNFRDFKIAYENGTIAADAAWRAYDIEDMVTDKRSREGLRLVAPDYRADYYGYSAFGALYGMNWQRTKLLLGLWRTWQRIATGEAKRRLKLREFNL